MNQTQQLINKTVNEHFRHALQKPFTAYDVTKKMRELYPTEKIFHNSIRFNIHRALDTTYKFAFNKNEVCLESITGKLSDIDTFVMLYEPSKNVDAKKIFFRADGKLEIPSKALITTGVCYSEECFVIADTKRNEVIIISDDAIIDYAYPGEELKKAFDIDEFTVVSFDINGRLRIPTSVTDKFMMNIDDVYVTERNYTNSKGQFDIIVLSLVSND